MKVSIITVCYNSEKYIADALRSVDIQSFANKEHLVIDGASTDQTLAVVEQYSQPWRRVISEPDRGLYDAMNKGLDIARGDVVGFINSDDFYPDPHVLERIMIAFSDPGIDALYGDLCYVRQDEPSVIVRYWRSSGFRPGLFAKAWCPPHPTLFVRRSVYQRLGGFNLDFPIAADMELMARFLEVERIKARYIPKVLVHMRMGGTTNRSVKNIIQQNQEIWHALAFHGLKRSLPMFVVRKLFARLQQFLARPGP